MSEQIMTPEQMAWYMRGGRCPHCGSSSVDCDDGFEAFTAENDVAGVYAALTCVNCDCRWEEQYHMVRVVVSDLEIVNVDSEPAVSIESFED